MIFAGPAKKNVLGSEDSPLHLLDDSCRAAENHSAHPAETRLELEGPWVVVTYSKQYLYTPYYKTA